MHAADAIVTTRGNQGGPIRNTVGKFSVNVQQDKRFDLTKVNEKKNNRYTRTNTYMYT